MIDRFSTLYCNYSVVWVEEEGDGNAFQLDESWGSSGVKYEDELESTGPGDELASDSRNCKTSV